MVRNIFSLRHLYLKDFNIIVTLGPHSSGEKDAAAARTDYPIPAACGIYYYEIEIVDKGHKG
jgi:hypothetical protein